MGAKCKRHDIYGSVNCILYKLNSLGKPQFKGKKNFFKIFFFILLPFKNKNYFTLDNLSKYGNIGW